MNRYHYVIFVSLLSACTLAPIKEVASIKSEDPLPVASKFIITQAKKCWVREANWTKDEIKIKTIQNEDSNIIIVGRDNTDIPFQPFMEIRLSPINTGTEILIKEGSYAYNTYLNLANDLKRWFFGDSTCSKLAA
jgi:hypothetical protein